MDAVGYRRMIKQKCGQLATRQAENGFIIYSNSLEKVILIKHEIAGISRRRRTVNRWRVVDPAGNKQISPFRFELFSLEVCWHRSCIRAHNCSV